MSLFDIFRRTLPASDAGLTDDPGQLVQPKPIRILHYPLAVPKSVRAGALVTGHLTTTDGGGRTELVDTPTVSMSRDMVVDRVTKIEVIDDLGYDIGVGYIWGKVART